MECTICYETQEAKQLSCCHTICVHCYGKIMNTNPKCPYCRVSLEDKEHVEDSFGELSIWFEPIFTIVMLLKCVLHLYYFT